MGETPKGPEGQSAATPEPQTTDQQGITPKYNDELANIGVLLEKKRALVREEEQAIAEGRRSITQEQLEHAKEEIRALEQKGINLQKK